MALRALAKSMVDQAVVGALIDELVTRRNITVAMPAFSIETSMLNQLKVETVWCENHANFV